MRAISLFVCVSSALAFQLPEGVSGPKINGGAASTFDFQGYLNRTRDIKPHVQIMPAIYNDGAGGAAGPHVRPAFFNGSNPFASINATSIQAKLANFTDLRNSFTDKMRDSSPFIKSKNSFGFPGFAFGNASQECKDTLKNFGLTILNKTIAEVRTEGSKMAQVCGFKDSYDKIASKEAELKSQIKANLTKLTSSLPGYINQLMSMGENEQQTVMEIKEQQENFFKNVQAENPLAARVLAFIAQSVTGDIMTTAFGGSPGGGHGNFGSIGATSFNVPSNLRFANVQTQDDVVNTQVVEEESHKKKNKNKNKKNQKKNEKKNKKNKKTTDSEEDSE